MQAVLSIAATCDRDNLVEEFMIPVFFERYLG